MYKRLFPNLIGLALIAMTFTMCKSQSAVAPSTPDEFGSLNRKELRQAAELTARAFSDYEYFTNLFPDPKERAKVEIAIIWCSYKTNFSSAPQLTAKLDGKIVALAELNAPDHKDPSVQGESDKESEIAQIEYNLATAPNARVSDICSKQLAKVEGERDEILRQLEERDKSIFPDGLVYDKKNDDIEPLSKNEFMFVYDLKSVGYEEKEKGQTLNFEGLSNFAPELGLEPRTL